ncbi:MAG: ATP-binding protein [Candidatus Krumholzibacteriia bacterium]
MEKRFNRGFEALDGIFEFVSAFITELRLEEGVAYSINLAVEELFTNMVKYNSGAEDRILIRMSNDPESVTVELVDFNVDPFDPDTVEEVTTGKPIEERSPGGLGLHLVKSIVDKVSYEYEDRRMKVTVVKRLAGD